MRTRAKSWQDRRPGWTWRVTWYDGITDIRLKFEDPQGSRSVVYPNSVAAQAAYDAFRRTATDG